MSVALCCDWCGKPIANDEPRARFAGWTVGGVTRSAFEHAFKRKRDYHASNGHDCYTQMMDTLAALHDLWHERSGRSAKLSLPMFSSAPPTPGRPRWLRMTSVPEREHAVLNVIGDGRLTMREVTEALEVEHPDSFIDSTTVTSVVNRLYKRRDLDRVGELYRSRTRYRYFRRIELEGSIADLERSFSEGA